MSLGVPRVSLGWPRPAALDVIGCAPRVIGLAAAGNRPNSPLSRRSVLCRIDPAAVAQSKMYSLYTVHFRRKYEIVSNSHWWVRIQQWTFFLVYQLYKMYNHKVKTIWNFHLLALMKILLWPPSLWAVQSVQSAQLFGGK